MPALHLPDCVNARDLAGLPLGPDRTVCPGVLLRSDNHDRLTPEGIQTVRDLRASRILDVRYEWEARTFPSPFADDPIYCNRSLDGDRSDFDPTAPDDFRPIIDRFPNLVAAVFIELAEAPAGPDIVADYALSDGTDKEVGSHL